MDAVGKTHSHNKHNISRSCSSYIIDNPSYFMGTTASNASSPKRKFRSLLRSVSAQDKVSHQRLVLGDPRPSDKPPSRSQQHQQQPTTSTGSRHRRIQSSNRHVKTSLELLNTDMVYCSPDSVRYYNLTMPLAGRRRHSIGTFLKPEPKTQHHQPAKRKVKQRRMADIVIISKGSSQAASTWVEYLTSCFHVISKQKKRQPYKVVMLDVEELVAKSSNSMTYKKARLYILVVCPVLLDTITGLESCFNMMSSERVLAMLLGVDEEGVLDGHKMALGSSYDQWKRFVVVDQDETFVGTFLEEAVKILSLPLVTQAFSLTPKKVKEGANKVIIMLTEPASKEDIFAITMDKQGSVHEITGIRLRNPYTLTFTIPCSCLQVSQLVIINIFKNGITLGQRQIKCESRIRELEQLLRSTCQPLELMCQSLGFNDREQLDSYLVTTFQRNIPPHFNLLQSCDISSGKSSDEMPSLLHFAALHGLHRLAWQLLECPGGETACQVKNVNDLVPADLAESSGHSKLASQLRGYMQMNEFSNMYSYLKVMSGEDTDYQLPRPIEETYQIPANSFSESTYQVPRNMDENYSIPPPARPLPSYMDMSFDLTPLQTAMKESLPDSQDELVEIINDFKNNVLSITEVEKLVASWKQRNDVQESFKDKQEKLNMMREQYDRLQQQMKDNDRSSTPLDRIKNFFKGNKAKEVKLESKLALRPGSSCSSTSSGRMSTVSACSLGDSGTHSDQERHGNRYYDIPPAPRQLTIPSFYAPDIPIQDRPPEPLPRPELTEEEEVDYITPLEEGAEQIIREDNVEYLDMNNKLPDYMNTTASPPPLPARPRT